MRAFSSKKYNEPVVSGSSLILSSRDGLTEVRVFEPIKYITLDNKSVIYRPATVSVAKTALMSVRD